MITPSNAIQGMISNLYQARLDRSVQLYPEYLILLQLEKSIVTPRFLFVLRRV
jgi:hypothetical protein